MGARAALVGRARIPMGRECSSERACGRTRTRDRVRRARALASRSSRGGEAARERISAGRAMRLPAAVPTARCPAGSGERAQGKARTGAGGSSPNPKEGLRLDRPASGPLSAQESSFADPEAERLPASLAVGPDPLGALLRGRLRGLALVSVLQEAECRRTPARHAGVIPLAPRAVRAGIVSRPDVTDAHAQSTARSGKVRPEAVCAWACAKEVGPVAAVQEFGFCAHLPKRAGSRGRDVRIEAAWARFRTHRRRAEVSARMGAR